MLLALGLAFLSNVTLDQVYDKVKAFPGVEISAEMVRPSSVAMTFKIAPGGYLWVRYPTSESFINQKEQINWMPDMRQYAKSKPEGGNPLPVGFDSMWPSGRNLTPKGDSREAVFAGKNAYEIPCVATEGHPVSLFVDRTSFMPLGSIATAGGREYEMRYKSVKVVPISPKSITFVPPPDAVPYKGERPDAKLVKPGAKLTPFLATDLDGKPASSAQLMQGKRGLVLNYWFSACTGCVQEMPYLSKLDPKLREQGIILLGVNPVDPLDNARKTSKVNKLPFRTIAGNKAKDLAKQLGIMAYPVTVVVDDKGVIVDAIMGFDEARLKTALGKIGYVSP